MNPVQFLAWGGGGGGGGGEVVQSNVSCMFPSEVRFYCTA